MPLQPVADDLQSCAAGEQLIFEDRALSDIDSGLRSKLQSFPFLSFIGSLGYCESYVFPPVQRVACLITSSGILRHVLFYNERRLAGLVRAIEIIGPTDPHCELVQRVTRDRHPSLLTFSMQTAGSFPQSAADQERFELRVAANNYKIALPANADEYLQQLGRQTRKHLPYYVRRLQREWGSDYAFNVTSGDKISWESFDALLKLNRLRMRNKRRLSLWSPEIVKHRWPLFRGSGIMGCLHRGKSIVAATLSLSGGEEAYLILLAHDPQYDHFNLGNVCLWKTIEYLIESGYASFHLMWGNSFYKEQFRGQPEVLHNVSYAVNLRVAALARCLRLVERGADFWRRVQRKFTALYESPVIGSGL